MLIERGAPGFDDLLRRLIWNVRSPERRSPDAVVLPVSTEEVAAAIRDAARRGQRVALRGSGHNYQGAALRDEGFAYADAFRAAYPSVTVHPERVLVVSGRREDLLSSGASSSWHDLALYLIARYAGATIAQALARELGATIRQ